VSSSNLIEICQEYCTGCGLCVSERDKQFSEDQKHFLYPNLDSTDQEFCSTVCPASGNAVNNHATGSIWGNVISSYLGWSSDEEARYRASSGGVTTAACLYLIEQGLVDGIIQTKKDPLDLRKTITVVSKTKNDVLECTGSRYTTSSPLQKIRELIEPGKKYAFVGKPCDVSALRMYMISGKAGWTKQIVYLFSFFCAGQPSLKANDRLLSALGCENPEDLKELSYRGNGWPGVAQAILKSGQSNEMEYEKSWMTILGRDVRKCCRFCADGTGEMADVSSGDAWYLTSEGKPDFHEHPGRNVVFTRTEVGDALLKKMIQDRAVIVERYDAEKDGLKKSQPYHYNRKASLGSLRIAMILCGRNFPRYSGEKMKMFAAGYPLKSKVLRCVGTMKRVWSKSI